MDLTKEPTSDGRGGLEENEASKVVEASGFEQLLVKIKKTQAEIQQLVDTVITAIQYRSETNLQRDQRDLSEIVDDFLDLTLNKEGYGLLTQYEKYRDLYQELNELINALSAKNRLREEELRSLKTEYNEKSKESDKVNNLRFLKKLFMGRRKKELDQSLYELRNQLRDLENRLWSNEEYEKINAVLKQVRQAKDKLFSDILNQAMDSLSGGYDDIIQDLLKDGELENEVRDFYIQQTIEPVLEQYQVKQDITAEIKEKILQILRSPVNESVSFTEGIYSKKTQLQEVIGSSNHYSSLMELCDPVLSDKVKIFIIQTVAMVVADQVNEIIEVVNAQTDVEPITRDSLVTSIKNRIQRPSLVTHYFQNKIANQLNKDLKEDKPQMRIWSVAKYSPKLLSLFGEVIDKNDHELYAYALDESLSEFGGDALELLEYYPTPDGIRNLLLVVGAELDNTFTSGAAHEALIKLSRSPQWSKLLDEAEKQYPELKTLRPVLENWRYNARDNIPQIRSSVTPLATSIINGEHSDARLKMLAIKNMPATEIIELLGKQQVIPVEHSSTLVAAFRYLGELNSQSTNRAKQQPPSEPSIPFVFNTDVDNALRNHALKLLEANDDETKMQLAATTAKFLMLAEKILANPNDLSYIKVAVNEQATKKLNNPIIDQGAYSSFLESYIPLLIQTVGYNSDSIAYYLQEFKSEESSIHFSNLFKAYGQYSNRAQRINDLIQKGKITLERAMVLPSKDTKFLENFQMFNLATSFPDIYLAQDTGLILLHKIISAYQDDFYIAVEISSTITNDPASADVALEFPKLAPVLMGQDMDGIRRFLFEQAKVIMKSTADIRFFVRLVGMFGKKSYDIIKNYCISVESGAIGINDKELVLEFLSSFRILTPTILHGYKEAKQSGQEKIYLSKLENLAARMTGSGVISDSERSSPYYNDLLKHVYQNNSGQWSSHGNNASCPDRSSDLDGLIVAKKYDIDLLSQSKIRVKTGEQIDQQAIEEAKKPILDLAAVMNEMGHDKTKTMEDLNQQVTAALEKIVAKGGLPNIDLTKINTLEEKMFLVLVDSLYGTRSVGFNRVKRLYIYYEFVNFEDIRDYIAGTTDRVSRASNQDYALLCEINAFYADRIKEVGRILVQKSWENPVIAEAMKQYFADLSQQLLERKEQEQRNKLHVDKLGLSDGFIRQVTKILQERTKRKYSPEKVRKIIKRYEIWTGGLTATNSESENEKTRSFYGSLRSQREKSFQTFQQVTGIQIDPSAIGLGELDLQQILETEQLIVKGQYDSEQFAAYTMQRILDIFEMEKTQIETELEKFESESGQKRELLYGYITKSKESANARMVGGVCVSGDNPNRHAQNNLWSMPNYLQLVLQEPDTLQCQGLVLLHSFDQNGQKILTASFNPSSTYLYSVDEEALFSGLFGAIEQFASDNGFNLVVVSKNKAIRTNRTGGKFESAIDQRITEVNKPFKFDTPKTFSFNPKYDLQEMDVIWERVKQ